MAFDALVRRFVAGDEDALAELDAAFCATIGRRLARRYASISPDRGEHIALCALMRAWQGRAQFDPSLGTFEAWLWRIALNEAADFLASPAGHACSFESTMGPAELIQVCDHWVVARGDAARHPRAAPEEVGPTRAAVAAAALSVRAAGRYGRRWHGRQRHAGRRAGRDRVDDPLLAKKS